jgi:hypothetical protein
MSVYAVRLQEDKIAVGLMYAGSQRQLFEEIDQHCDPYACEYKPIWLNIFFNGTKEEGCPTFPLVSKEEAKAIEENEDSEEDVYIISSEREEKLWKRATVNIDDYGMQIASIHDDDSDWENFDDYNWLEDIREHNKQIKESV